MKKTDDSSFFAFLKEELSKLIVPLLGTMLAVLTVFTTPIWNYDRNIAYLILILFSLMAFSICIWRLLFFVFVVKRPVLLQANITCIISYLVLLITALTIAIAGHIYWRNLGPVEIKEMNTFMMAKCPADISIITVRSIPYGKGGVKGTLQDGMPVYVIKRGVNSHGHVWYQTELGWVFDDHLVEFPDKDEELKLSNEKHLREWTKSNRTIFVMTVCVALTLLFAITYYAVKWLKRNVHSVSGG